MGFTGLKSRCWQGCTPSGGSRENSSPCLFQLPWLMTPSSIFKASNVASSTLSLTVTFCFHHHISFSDSDPPPSLPLSYEEPCDYIRPIWVIHNNLPISRFFFFFFFFLAAPHSMRDLSFPTVPPAVEARRLNHWTTREVPKFLT